MPFLDFPIFKKEFENFVRPLRRPKSLEKYCSSTLTDENKKENEIPVWRNK